MEIWSRPSFILLISVLSLVQTNGVAGNPNAGSDWERNKEIIIPTTTREPPIEVSTCPNASTISPCSCNKYFSDLSIDCSGSLLDQTGIENALRELRRVNGIPEDRGFSLSQFRLWGTELTQFDLAPLYGSRMNFLYIQDNFKLTKWVNSGNPEDHGSIHVDWFQLYDARINEEEFGDTFKYFSPEMTKFYASNVSVNPNLNNNNNADEGEFQFEFLPGLSAFVNLERLYILDCNISGGLNSSHFKAFPRLQEIYLYDNQIDEIGENVFSPNVSSIHLRGNKLNETSFHPESGIANNQTGIQKTLILSDNQITTLPIKIFQTFLDSRPYNYLYLEDNPLICDERLSWIKSRRQEFWNWVPNAYCSNDRGHNIFESDLIP